MWHWLDKLITRSKPDPATFTRCAKPHLQNGGIVILQTGNQAEIIRGGQETRRTQSN